MNLDLNQFELQMENLRKTNEIERLQNVIQRRNSEIADLRAKALIKEYESIPTAPDMSKKCENLNTSPLTPISFSERLPERGERIFVFDSLTKEWVKMQAGDMEPTFHPDFTHWLPQDALPVPVEEKSLADELEEEANKERTAMGKTYASGLMLRAAKELRK